MSWRVVILPTALIVCAAMTAPHPSFAKRTATRSWRAQAGANQPVTGGVLELLAPLTRAIRLRSLSFQMGSSEKEVIDAYAQCTDEPLKQLCSPKQFADETPRRQVYVAEFWLDTTEVSVSDYSRCVAARRCDAPPYSLGAARFQGDHFPVSLVTWHDARDYCKFVNKRLPTEAEFERAARGQEQRTYPWGKLYNSRASNHGQLAMPRTSTTDGFRELAPLASFPFGATSDGIYDLAGNVAEWVNDRYAPNYLPGDTQDPRGPATGDIDGRRVLRGGHYESPKSDLRSASRFPAAADERRTVFGFRCAR